jgi:ribonuclease E
MKSIAPALIYEESSLVKRAIRDLYDKDVDEIHVDGENAYKEAKDFVRMLMPSHAKRVHLWKDTTPIFAKNGVERQLDSIYSPIVTLKSGGYLVINQAEALVAIDVNSGRATRERNIEQTALKTNLEAADEAARQMRLRDLAGLIVIDFIDMEEPKNDRSVEKRMKDSLRFDRARVQMGKISGFGLLELSRQRRRTGVLEGTSHVCPHCQGAGRVRSVESAALALLRTLDEAAAKNRNHLIEVRAPTEVALYLLNEKREALATLEANRKVRLRVAASSHLTPPDFELNIANAEFQDDVPDAEVEARAPTPSYEAEEEVEDEAVEADEPEEEDEESEVEAPRASADAEGDGDGRRRRRRGRRGGRRRREDEGGETAAAEPREEKPTPAAAAANGDDRGRRRKRRGRGRGKRVYEVDGGEWLDFVSSDLKSLTPRPQHPPRRERAPEAEAAVEAEAPAEIIQHPAMIEAPVEAPAVYAMAEAEEAVVAVSAPLEPQPEYEPDQERRDKFLSRFSRWAKK